MSCKSKVERLIEKTENLIAENETLETSNAELTENVERLTASNAELTASNEALQGENESLEAENETLETRNAELEASIKPEQEKAVTITENGTTKVLPDDGKTLSKVNVTVDVEAGNPEAEATLAEIEGSIDQSGVLEDTEGSVTQKVEELIDKAKLGEKIILTDAKQLFLSNRLLDYIDRFDFSLVSDFTGAFQGCTQLTSTPLIDTSNAIIMKNMFYQCRITEVDNFNTSKVTDMSGAFANSFLTDVKNLDISRATNLSQVFYNCVSLKNVCQLNVSSAITLSQMFYNCSLLQEVAFVKECIKVSIDFGMSPLLSAESIQSIIDGLATVETAQTLTLNSATVLTDEQKATINEKGWTLAQ